MKLLLSGLDTIECAYYLRPGSDCKIDFEALRAQRESLRQSRESEAAVVNFGAEEFLLSPNGSKSGYPFILSNQDMTIQLGEFNDPSFFVKYSSFALWCKGAQKMHERFLAWAQGLGFEVVRPEGVSRVDFAFDFHLPEINFDEDNFVSSADKDSQHRKNGQIQTFTYGRDEVVLRVYNKSAEIEEASKKYWFYLFWNGIEKDVWRVEWQIRKETLKRFGLRTFADLFEGYGDALRYLISEHTSLRVKSDDSNRSRWPIHPLWSMLAEHIQTLPAQGIYREVEPAYMLDETLMRMAISMEGYLKKVAAIECLKEGRSMLSQGQAIERLIPLLEKVHNRLTWRTDVQKRMDQLRLAP
jgi:hypothetical protein